MRHIALLVLGSSFAACSSSSSTKPTAEQYDDTAQAMASQTSTSGGGGDVASMSDAVSISLGVMPVGFSLQGDGHFRGTRLGVDYNYAITCKTAGGTVGVCGPATDEASVEVAWSGALKSTNVDATVTRSGSWKLTGLQSSNVTVTGTGDFSFDTTLRSIFRPGVTATYEFDASATYQAVKITTQDRKAIDGSASFDLSAHAKVTGAGSNNADTSFDVHAEITFHADHTATLVLDGSQRYTLDLNTGVVVRVSA